MDGRERKALARKAFLIARDLGLSDVERRELAAMLPGTDVAPNGQRSWAGLERDDLAHLILWLEGARLVRDLMRLRG